MTGLRWVRFESAALGDIACEVKELSGEEELNRLFWFVAHLVIPDVAAARGLPLDLLRRPVALVFEGADGELSRVHGIAARVQHAEPAEEGAAVCSVTIVPRVWVLSLTRRSEIFLDRSVPQVLAEKLSGAGFEEARDFVLALRGRYAVRESVTQYDESDLDFICRLCDELGIAFFFQQREGREVLVITDTADVFEPIARSPPELHVSARREDRAAPLGLAGVLLVSLGCSTSPHHHPSGSTGSAVSAHVSTPAVSSSGSGPVTASPPSARAASPAPPVDTTSQPRAKIDGDNAYYFVDFPTSISEDGQSIAAITSTAGEIESYFPEWLVIKDVKKDKIEQTIDLIDPELSWRLRTTCRDNLSACIPEVERRVEKANAVLATRRWRPLPCFLTPGSQRPERMGAGCELLWELKVDFQDPQLVISRGGRRLVARAVPAWSPTHDPSCKGRIESFVESVAFDPETGLLVIGLRFAGSEGGECPAPSWDFHPIRLPVARGEPPRDSDGGAP